MQGWPVRLLVASALWGLLAAPASASASAASGEPTLAVHDALLATVEAEAARVFKSRDEDGVKNRRATFSKKFTPGDDGRWRVSFTEDTAGRERMLTERFVLTLEPGDDGLWNVAYRERLQSHEKLIRGLPGDERFFRFSTFRTSYEGMTLRASKGTMVVDFLLGEPRSFRLYSDDLTHEFRFPDDVRGYQASLLPHLQEESPEALDLDAHVAVVRCDAETCARLLETDFSGLEEIGVAGLDEPLARQHRESIERQEKRLAEAAFTGFRLPDEPDRRALRLQVIDQSEEHSFALTYDSTEAREVSIVARGFGRLFSYPSARSRAEVSPANIERRVDADARDYELLELDGSVQLAVGNSELVRGEVEFTLRANRDLDEIRFGLGDLSGFGGRRSSDRDPSLTVNSLTDTGGNDLLWVRLDAASGIIVFPETLPQGEEFVLRLDWENEGSILKFSPTYSYMDRGGWLPFVRYTDRIEDFSLRVTTPERYETLCVGSKLDDSVTGELRTAHCAGHEVHFPTVIFGVYYDDEPKIAARKSDGTEIPVKVHVDKDSMAAWNIRGKQLRPIGEQAVNALNLYREIFGIDYPYDKLDLVNDAGGIGAQSPASMVYVGSPVFRGEGALGSLSPFVRSLVAHEVGHQWWGSAVGNANMRNYWFVESLAEYASALFIEAVTTAQQGPEKGRRAYLDHVAEWRTEILDSDLLTSVKDARVLYAGAGGYRAAVYAKGPYAFHMIRVTVGDDGLFAFLKNLGQQLVGREIVTSDIEEVASSTFDTDLGWFFDQWIRGIGTPEFTFAYETRPTESGNWIVSGVIRQRVLAGKNKYELEGVHYEGLVAITVRGQDKREYPARLIVQGAETPFQFAVPAKPVEVTLNKYGEMLAHDVLMPEGR